MQQRPPELTKCPQCGSEGCGPLRCRFSLIDHGEFKRIERRINRAVRVKRNAPGVRVQIAIDSRRRDWYEYVAKQLGVSFSFADQAHSTDMTINTKETT